MAEGAWLEKGPACTLMWGVEEGDDDALLQCDCDQWLNRDLQKPTGENPKSAEDVDGCVLAALGSAGDNDGSEEQMLEEDPDEGFLGMPKSIRSAW